MPTLTPCVGVDSQVKVADPAQRRMKLGSDPPQPRPAGQQGLPAMQDNLHSTQSVRSRVLGYTPRRLRDHRIRDGCGAAPPALIGGLVDITVITREITATVHLQHELAEWHQGGLTGWNGRPAHVRPAGSDSRTEFRTRRRSWLWGRYNTAERLICGHSAQDYHRCQRYIAEICQLRRNSRFHGLSDLHSPANQCEPTTSWPATVGPFICSAPSALWLLRTRVVAGTLYCYYPE
jgi:hypothetical protein